ncbi:uncharacterized protein LOC117115100 [Anneissia japonica]|uniref:uncharacterized protein LOC117115100 n=1 Tax=Anneissia japonica TaxID=1529436 RepID=UPI00142565CD|nr:uncharacterized protein LOC117115100 [Anneissia japonica]
MGTGASREDGRWDSTRRPKSGHQSTRAEPGSVVHVQLTKEGFSPADLIITSGQVVSISWSCNTRQNVKQVVLDNQLVLEVIGGYDSGDLTYQGQYDIEFNIEGEFKFFSAGSGTGKILQVTVYSQSVIQAEVTDEGFTDNAWQIFQGNTIKWLWSGCESLRSVNEVQLCAKHTGVLRTKASDVEPSRTGNYKKKFESPGMFYFQTEGKSGGQLQLCIIQVKEIQREHKIDVTDTRYNPKLLTIHEGDKVWWEWSRLKCKKQHKIVQIQSPSATGSENLRPVRGGFMSEGPSRSGMLCHMFTSVGVYYYSDETIDGLKLNFGIIIVKPKEIVHPIEVSADGFYPDLQTICSGDRIQWEWNVHAVINTFSIMLIDSCVAGAGNSGSEVDCNNKCQYLDNDGEALVTCLGVTSVQLNTTGVFQYRISDSLMNVGGCSIIVQPGSKDHFIRISDKGFEPNSLTAHPGDRIWWTWEGSNLQHNISQVTSGGHPIEGGFCSGHPHSGTGAFLHEVIDTGVFYYHSSGLSNIYGSFVVKIQAKVHEVSVANNVVLPDPTLVQSNDCVAWLWPQLSKHDVIPVNHTREILDFKTYTQAILLPRRCIAKRFTNPGTYHYYSREFSTKGDKFMDEDVSCTVLSSVVVSNDPEHTLVKVTRKGFKPPIVTIQKGQSVMWSWKDHPNERHNIVHVNATEHPYPYGPMTGVEAFASNDDNNNEKCFMHAFQSYGNYYVTSMGTPGCVFIANVIDDDIYTSTPMISSECNGGVVKQWHKVLLKNSTDEETILYTLDGSIPEFHSANTRVYKDDQGICLKRPGLVVIRAVAICSNSLNSDIFTSNRFWVLKGELDDSCDEDDAFSIATEDFEEDEVGPTSRWQWWNCVPEVKGWIIEPGAVQVTWESPASEDVIQLKGYQVFIDGVCYRNLIPVTCTSVVVTGLPGGESHAVSVVALPSECNFLPLESNKLHVKYQLKSALGGPLTSCAIAEKDNSFYLSWPTLDLRGRGVSYSIYANGNQCGHKVQPQNGIKRCKVLIDDCQLHNKYNFHIQAKFEGSTEILKSNNLPITLPLSVSEIIPPAGQSLVELPFIQVIESKQKTHCLSKELLPTVDTSRKLEQSGITDNFGKPFPEEALYGRNSSFDVEREEVKHTGNDHQNEFRKTISLLDASSVKDEAEVPNEKGSSSIEVDNPKLLTTDVNDSDLNEIVEYSGEINKIAKKIVQNIIKDVEEEYFNNMNDGNMDEKEINEIKRDEMQDNTPSSMHEPSPTLLHNPAVHVGNPSDVSDNDSQCVQTTDSDVVESDTINIEKDNTKDGEDTDSDDSSSSDSSSSSLESSSSDDDTDDESDSTDSSSEDSSAAGKENFISNQSGGEADNKANVVLPTPTVVVRSHAKDSNISVQWQCARVNSTNYAFSHYMVHVEGASFSEGMHSHGRCEVVDDAGNEYIRHSWNADLANSITIKRLVENCTYRVFVTASFSHSDPKRGTLQTVSDSHECITGGRPQPPVLTVKSLSVQEVMLSWKAGICHRSIGVIGYQFFKNEKRKGSVTATTATEKCISKINPGTTNKYQVQAITDDGRNSDPSNTITITCPNKPAPPNLVVEPSTEAYTAQISWSTPKGSKGRVISSYCIYVNGKLHGNVSVDEDHQKSSKIKYKLQNLKPGKDYEVTAKTYAGWRTVMDSPDVLCGIMSEESSPIIVCCPAVPASPTPRLAGMHDRGIDITWDAVQPFGDAAISGYLLLKDGKSVLPIMDPHTQHHTVSDLVLGSTVILQIVALTDHPVGRLRQNGSDDGSIHSEDNDNEYFERDIQAEKYSACRPGLKLKVEYTGLVQPPTNVQCQNVTSQSAYITWQQSYDTSGHYISTEQYQVTWWASERRDRSVQSQRTQDTCFKLYSLDPDTRYTIVVEARKQEVYSTGSRDDRNSYTFILTGQSDQLHILTSKPPEAPHLIRLVSSTCSSVELSWRLPMCNGSQIIGLRMYVVTGDEDYCITESHLDLSPEAVSAVIPGLMENSPYKFILVVVTKEYFDSLQEKVKTDSEMSLPEEWVEVPEDSPWLPFVSVDAKTAGSEPPNNLRCVKYSQNSVTLVWDAPQYGSDRLLKYVVRWMAVCSKKKQSQSSLSEGTLEIFTEETSAEVKLFPGKIYSITVEAHLSDFYQASNDGGSNDGYITCLSSDTFQVRIPAPVEAPTLFIREFTTSSLELHWQKPVLFTALKASEKSGCHLCIHRHLLEYRVIVNGETYCKVDPSALYCSLKNLSSDKLYSIQIAAITNTSGTTKGSRQSLFDIVDQDESLSQPLELTLPKYESGNLVMVQASFSSARDHEGKNKRQESGELLVSWSVADCGTAEEQGIVGYNLNWISTADGKEHVASLPPDVMSYEIPVHFQRSVYDVRVNILKEDDMWQDLNNLSIQWIIPGSPDPPVIGCSSITPDEFILEWGAPRLFGSVGIRGYKVYMNDKPIGNELSVNHHRAVIPCRPNRTYHVSLVALCADTMYQDSLLSEELQLRSPGNIHECSITESNKPSARNRPSPTHSNSSTLPEDVFLNVSKVTDTTICIRWSRPSFEGDENVKRVKIQWSSVMKPKEIEALLKPVASQYTIRNCAAGAAHFVTVFLLDANDQVINRSKQISIDTAAPIQTPKLSIESYDFHQCTLKWNKPRVFGDTLLTGYRLKVNGKDLKTLLPQETSYVFTQGKMCREYAFSIQALCNVRFLNSDISDPVEVDWPGVIPPAIKRVPTTKAASIKVQWTEPKLTGGAEVEHYRAVLLDESAGQNKAQRRAATTLSPIIDPKTLTAEFCDLLISATYKVFLEVHLEGLERPVRSKAIVTKVAKKPSKPIVRYVVRGVAERRMLESDACNFINERDKVRVHLSAYHPTNKITVIATTDHAVGDSEPSDVIIVNTAPFKPFASYCFHSTHTKETRFPRVGSCAYVDSLMREIGPSNFNRVATLHHGFNTRKIPPASVSVIDVYDGAWHLLIPSKITNKNPTIILFWTKWCLAATKMLTFFVAYAKKKASVVSCIACCCASQESTGTHRHSLAQVIAGNGWRDDKVIRHCCCCHTSHAGLNPRRQTSSISRTLLASSGRRRRHSTVSLDMTHSSQSAKISVPELFGVIGVPTLVVLHSDGYIAWQGRFAAQDFSSFEMFLDRILKKVAGSKVREPSKTSAEQRLALSSLSSSTLQTVSPSAIPSSPPSPRRASPTFIRERNLRWVDKPQPSSQSKSSNSHGKPIKKISINRRPYSSACLKPKAPPRPKSSLTI